MSLLPEVSNPYLASFAAGLLYELVFCTSACLPYVTSFLAVLFSLGTALSPISLLGGATGWLLNKAPLFRKWISIVGAGILIVLGLGILLNVTIAAYS